MVGRVNRPYTHLPEGNQASKCSLHNNLVKCYQITKLLEPFTIVDKTPFTTLEHPCYYPLMTQKRKRGGQPGNQNGRTHGFYSKAVNPEHRKKLRTAADIKGLDQEIALLRLKINDAARDSLDYRVLIPGLSLLSRLLQTRHNLGYDDQEGLLAAITNVFNSVGIPLGLGNYKAPTPPEKVVENPENAPIPPDLPHSGNNDSASF